MKPWWHWTELFSEPIRFNGWILCKLGRHKMRMSSARWGVYKVWYVECVRLDCDYQEPPQWEHRQ